MMLFKFGNQLDKETVDTNLVKRIINNELASIIYKSALLYHEMRTTTSSTFELIRPKYFQEQIDLLQQETNSLYQFLKHDPEVYDDYQNVKICKKIVFGSEHSMSKIYFEKAYKKYCEHNSLTYSKINTEDGTFRKFKLTIKKKKQCMSCKKIYSTSCCSYSDRNKRSNADFIIGMNIIKERIE
jgi:hypothetical protein